MNIISEEEVRFLAKQEVLDTLNTSNVSYARAIDELKYKVNDIQNVRINSFEERLYCLEESIEHLTQLYENLSKILSWDKCIMNGLGGGSDERFK